jgi:tetratricopeptide (TPR) repeat protein
MAGMSTVKRSGLLISCLVFLSSAFAQSNRERLEPITSALRASEFEKALELLRSALQESPRNPQLWTLQGLALSGEKHEKEAMASFRNALKISPEYLPALEGAAQLEYQADSQDAVPLLQRLLRLRPGDPTTHAMLAALAYRRGDCATAVQHFNQGGSLVDSQPEMLQEVGDCLVRLQQTDQAISVFQKALAINPSDHRARYRLAVLQLTAERPKDTIDTLAPLLETDNPDATTLELAASACEANGDTPRAVQTLRQAIVTNPRDTDLYLDFANISLDHQSFQVGIDMVNAGLALQPQAAPLYVARGILYVQLEQYTEAEQDFEKADTLDPERSMGAVAQGLQAEQNNDPDRALATVRAKLASRPNDAPLLYLQADILAQKGPEPGSKEFQAAILSAKKAVSLQPTLTAARDVLAKLYLRAGQNQSAIEQSRKALSSDPKDQTALYHLIQALRKTGENAEITDLLKRLAELRAESTKIERQHDRYKLVEPSDPANQLARP